MADQKKKSTTPPRTTGTWQSEIAEFIRACTTLIKAATKKVRDSK